jgi:hypothetical protein
MRVMVGLVPTTINCAELPGIVGAIAWRAWAGGVASEVTLTVATEGPVLAALAPRAHGTDGPSNL